MVKIFKNCNYMYKLIWRFDKWRIIFIFILAIINCIQVLVSTFFFKFAIDAIIAQRPMNYFIGIVAIRLAIEVVNQMAESYFSTLLFSVGNNKVRKGFSHLLYNKVCEIDIGAFDDTEFYDKYSRALTEVNRRPIWMLETLRVFIGIGLNSIILIITLAYLSPFAILIAFAGVLVTFWGNIINGRKQYIYNKACTGVVRRFKYVERIFYLLPYAKDIRTTNLKGKMLEIFDEATDSYNNVIKKHIPSMANIEVIGIGIFNLLNLGVSSIYVWIQINNNQLTIGDFASVVMAITTLSAQLVQFSHEFTKFNEHALFIDDIIDILNYKSTLKFKEDGSKINQNSRYDIRLENISFTYNKTDKESINNLSMHIKSGQRVALVGENGAGKSTLIKLIMHLYEVDKGCIYINDEAYSEINLKSLYNSMAVVHQDFQAYALTMEENITLYNQGDEVEQTELKKILEATGLADIVEGLPNKLNTIMTKEFDEVGITLSGGQNQRMAIARALFSKANIIIMDEPSSALDPLAEEELFNMIDTQIPVSKTLIIVSHRLSGVKNMDNIFFMDNGQIIESGTHNELMKLNGKYAHMFLTQAQRYGV